MKWQTLRAVSLSITLASCGTETIVVASLDASAGTSGAGGDAGGGGGAGAGMQASGEGGRAGGSSGAMGMVIEGGTDSGVDLHGVPTASVCTCRGDRAVVCGADGVTYDATCADGCSQVTIECFHACPCSGGDAGAANVEAAEWVDEKCFDPQSCEIGSLCFSVDAPDAVPPCATR